MNSCDVTYISQITTSSNQKAVRGMINIAKDRRKTSRTSHMGCPICKEPSCKECWKEGYDKHA